MKGDFTRITFDRKKHYTGVLKQQGRVDLDADWNEYVAIQDYLDQTESQDVIGPCGAPKSGGGFEIGTTSSGELTISPGRIYVNGILCELEAETNYLDQPHYSPDTAITPEDGRADLVYLDVWLRHITAIEDPEIREKALGGPDTTTRIQTVWQVKVLEGETGTSYVCPDAFPGWEEATAASQARLCTRVDTAGPVSPDDLCLFTTSEGYRGLENRLYRVEIHRGGSLGSGSPPTFKWSRDNGSVAFAIKEFDGDDPTKMTVEQLGRDQVLGLHEDDWVEVLGDETDWDGERLGTLTQITEVDRANRKLTLQQDVSAHNTEKHPKVRRWDQRETNTITLDDGAVPVQEDTWIELEEGVQIRFKAGRTYRPGEYWVFAARVPTGLAPRGEVEHLEEAPPQGITHHYCKLALVTWEEDGENWKSTLQDCRPKFPPLTNIWAEDVYYDNERCQLVDTETVQDALDRLCAANDLRHHNKHLHGWGIVCGLKVVCGPDDVEEERKHVTVQQGYAIDCEGNDLIVEEPEGIVVDILREIERLNEENPDEPILDESGDGEVCLTLEPKPDEQRQVRVGVEPYDPSQNNLQAMLKGTLLMDFYNNCIKVVIDFIRDELTPDPGEEKLVIGPTHKRIITLLNLLIQLFNPAYGRYVYLSGQASLDEKRRTEHGILYALYWGLREILQSKTFCAMFDDVPFFPEYPFPDHDTTTIFGKGFHNRLRIHPKGRFGYTVGLNDKIHVYDFKKEDMVAEVEVPGGTGAVVRDVAFSKDGKQLYAVASLQETVGTVFAIADIKGPDLDWRPVGVICGVEMVTLGTAPSISEDVYAIGKSSEKSGLYAITPDSIEPDLQPIYDFSSVDQNAIGHLVIDKRRGIAYATAQAVGSDQADVYDRVVAINLKKPEEVTEFELTLVSDETSATGSDDIAVADLGQQSQLFVVVDPPDGTDNKLLLCFNTSTPEENPTIVDLQENTEIRLGHYPKSSYLMLSFADSYRIRLMEMRKFDLLDNYHLPVQIAPLGIVPSPNTEKVYVLNFVSNTITAIAADYLDPSAQVDVDPVPGSQQYLNTLEAYRKDIFEAFLGLVGGFLQYLKDCLCDHFLVNCPECNPDDKVYLGCISVRNNQVYKACNFARRRYVKSFPTVGYWLSLVPITPFIHKAVELLCCAVIPNFFLRFFQNQETTERAAPVKTRDMRYGIALAQTTDFRGILRERVGQLNIAQRATGDWLKVKGKQAIIRQPRPPAAQQSDVIGQPVAEASKKIEEKNVVVAKVAKYDPAQGPKNLRDITQAPSRIEAGSRVTLYEENGIVRYYALEEKPSEAVVTLRTEVEAQKETLAEVETLKTTLTQMQDLIAHKDEEIVSLRQQMQTLEEKQTTLETTIAPAKIAEVEAELKELRNFRKEVNQFMGRTDEPT